MPIWLRIALQTIDGPIVPTSQAPVSHLLGDPARAGEHEAHRLVPEIRGRVEHQRAAPVDHGDPVLATVFGGRLRNAAGPGAVMHPHVPDTEIHALPHGGLGNL